MGHYYHHEAVLGDLVSLDSGEEESDEEVWDPLMYFQEGEPIRELNIFMETKIERQENGLTVTVSDTFERFHPLIYIGKLRFQNLHVQCSYPLDIFT